MIRMIQRLLFFVCASINYIIIGNTFYLQNHFTMYSVSYEIKGVLPLFEFYIFFTPNSIIYTRRFRQFLMAVCSAKRRKYGVKSSLGLSQAK